MASGGAVRTPVDVLTVVREAVGRVLALDPVTLDAATTFASLHADSLVLVSVADVVEEAMSAQGGPAVRIDDGALARMTTLGDLRDDVTTRIAS